MDRTVEHIEFNMYLSDLKSIRAFALPPGYSIRLFEPDDERFWVDIEMRAGEFSTPERGFAAFDRDFRPHHSKLSRQMHFLVHEEDGPVGTATAWFGIHDGRSIGQLHWVAIVPEHQGKGLAKPLVSAVLQRIAEDHSEAFLSTQTWSWRAVALYRGFGFLPVIDGPDAVRAIEIVDAKLGVAER
jgi:ribosomal protein S18 acetylase RimI-like enzyme